MTDQELTEKLRIIDAQLATLREYARGQERAIQAIYVALRDNVRYSTPRELQDSKSAS